jgi:hypothetical protein
MRVRERAVLIPFIRLSVGNMFIIVVILLCEVVGSLRIHGDIGW